MTNWLKPRISKIGLGCVTFGREIDQAASFAMMDHAVANGITFFDTASAYSAGGSEKVVGAWLAARKPATLAAMSQISGIGQSKLDNYGKIFLAVISNHETNQLLAEAGSDLPMG